MLKNDTQLTVRLLKQELESWRSFIDALRADDREIVHNLLEKCWQYVGAIESSEKNYLVEPFFLTILLMQEKRLRALEAEMMRLREEISAWKSRAGF
jgi:hypothetical protein